MVQIFDLWEQKRIHSFNPNIGSMPYDICCSPDNKYLIIAGNSSKVCLYDIEKREVKKYLQGHKQGAVPWVAVTNDLKFVLTSSYTETIIWNASTWEDIVVIEEKIIIAYSKHRILMGILHEGLYKAWSEKLITQFTDDYEYIEDEKTKNASANEVKISGTMNCIYPCILEKLHNDSKSQQINYIAAITDNIIQPFRVSVMHFLSYNNNSNALFYALKYGAKYQRDKFGKTPLQYSMDRKSFECTKLLLEYIMSKENIY